MANEGKGRLFRRKDGKYLIYLPVDFAEHSMFPFKEWNTNKTTASASIDVKVSFKPGDNKLIIEEWKDPEK